LLMSRCWMISSPARLCAGSEVGEGRKGGRIGRGAADMHMHAPTTSATAKPQAAAEEHTKPRRSSAQAWRGAAVPGGRASRRKGHPEG
jgi:hypothetical protein